jgi:uncharacterized glyoxalase superfamily protein PhnB
MASRTQLDWADRSYRVEDPEGHQWWFMQCLRDHGQPTK